MLLSVEGDEAVGKTTLAYTAPLPIVGFAFDMGAERAIYGGRFEEMFKGLRINMVPYVKGEPPSLTAWHDFDITVFELPQPIQLDAVRVKGCSALWNTFIQALAEAVIDPRVASIVVDTMTVARRLKADAYLEGLQDKAFKPNGERIPGVEMRERLLQIEWGNANDPIRNIYCVGPDTPILTIDLKWKAASELSVSDGILGFEDYSPGSGSGRSLLSASVMHNDTIKVQGYRITLDNGAVIDATPEHMWLIDNHGSGGGAKIVWRSTERLYQLRNDRRRLGLMTLRQVVPFKQHESSYDSGFLAAAMDGEGALIQGHANSSQTGLRLSFGQKANSFQRAVAVKLLDSGYNPKLANSRPDGVEYLNLNRSSEVMEFLMRTRPPRLLDKWLNRWSNGSQRLSIPPMPNIGIVDIRPVNCWVSRLSSSTGTYIAAGFGAHNTTLAGVKKNLVAIHHLTDERKDSIGRDGKIEQILTGERILEGLGNTYRFVDTAIRMTKSGGVPSGKLRKCGYNMKQEGMMIESPSWDSIADLIAMGSGDRIQVGRRNNVEVS